MKNLLKSKPVFGWAMYDFANSAYATTVMAVVFSVYFTNVLIPKEGIRVLGMLIPGESVWSYIVAITMGWVILISPTLGAWADAKALKKKFLIFFTGIGVMGTVMLFWATPQMMWFAIGVQGLGLFGYEMSQVFYNAFLNDIAEDKVKGRASGAGFALGYIGGGLALGLVLLLILKGNWGADTTLSVRVGMVITGLWWLVFSIPAFLWLKDKPLKKEKTFHVGRSILQFVWTLKFIFKTKNLRNFLVAFLLYNDGIQTFLIMAAIFGAKVIGMSTLQLGLCYLVIQFVAFVGATVMGERADNWGHKKVIFLTLVVYMGVSLWALVMKSPVEYWILGVLVGFVLGGSQSASRSLYALIIPNEKSGELFAFYAVVGKAASFFGPLIFGIVAQFIGLRAAVASLIFFFITGALFLTFVKEPTKD